MYTIPKKVGISNQPKFYEIGISNGSFTNPSLGDHSWSPIADRNEIFSRGFQVGRTLARGKGNKNCASLRWKRRGWKWPGVATGSLLHSYGKRTSYIYVRLIYWFWTWTIVEIVDLPKLWIFPVRYVKLREGSHPIAYPNNGLCLVLFKPRSGMLWNMAHL